MTIKTSIFNWFGNAPIIPLQEHMQKVHQAVEQLQPFFATVSQQDWQAAQQLQTDIATLENQADQIKQDLRLNLSNSLFLPISRVDLFELLATQDRIANQAKDIAGLVLGRKLQLPLMIQEDFLAYLNCSIACSKQALQAVLQLSELLDVGFRGHEVQIVESMINTIGQIECDTDVIQRDLRHKLYRIENTLNPIDAIFIYQLIDWVGSLADRAEKVGGQLQLILIK